MDAYTTTRPTRYRISFGFGRAPRFVLASSRLGARFAVVRFMGAA